MSSNITNRREDLNALEVLQPAFHRMSEARNDLWGVIRCELPENVITEAFQDFIERIDILRRVAQEQFTIHIHDVRRRARERRFHVQEEEEAIRIRIQQENMNTLPLQQQPQPWRRARVTRALKASDVNALLPDDCSICLEKYTKVNSVNISCGHTFCKPCFNAHEKVCYEKTIPIVQCPMCRNVNPIITEYRPRKQVQKK